MMIPVKTTLGDDQPAVRRLAALATLDEADMLALARAVARQRTVRPRGELLREGKAVGERLLVLDGWAARTRIMEDGRRQIINFTLPGDLIGNCDQALPIASSTISALTAVTVCPAPDPASSSGLSEAYAMSSAIEEAYLFAQITRLGRMSANERVEDLLLELLERLELAGLAEKGRYPIPITQETLADALGLTSVHVNRMLQQSRQAKRLSWARGTLQIADADEMRRDVGRLRTRVSK